MSDGKLTLGGRFFVLTDGTVLRVLPDGKMQEAKQSNCNGYRTVTFMEDGKQKMAYVHRIVAGAFIPNPERKKEVNHKDGNKANNRVDNLEWATRQENLQHAIDNGLVNRMAYGHFCPTCGKLTASKEKLCYTCRRQLDMERAREKRKAKWVKRFQGIDLEHLKPEDRECVELALDGLYERDIAEVYGVSRQAVQCRLARILRQ